ncbi:MAG: hypothetical protein WC712_06435 [Candidatus Brocadiia bacterium]
MRFAILKHFRNLFNRQNPVSLRKRMKLANGKARRFMSAMLARDILSDLRDLRKGRCIRCGTCCQLLYECPNLSYDERGDAVCKIHESKPLICDLFPCTPKDLTDRDIVNPLQKCGYSFASEADKISAKMGLARMIFRFRRRNGKQKSKG